jgi:hypothetical protein
MPQYKIGESIYTVADDAVENFLSVAEQNNDAPELIQETIEVDPGKKVTPKQQDASAESVKTASDMDSYSGIGSADYGKQTVTKPTAVAEEIIVEDKLERPFASIDGVSYTFTELEAAAAKYNLTLNSYLRKLQLDRTTTGEKRVDIYSDPEILEEVVVIGEDKSEKRKSERKLYDYINKKAFQASADPKTLSDARAKIYFGEFDSADLQGFASIGDAIKNKFGDKAPFYQEYRKTGAFKLPDDLQDENITDQAQQLISANIFEEEIGKLPEALQSNLKAYSKEGFPFQTKEQIGDYAEFTSSDIENRVNFVNESKNNLINNPEYKLFINQLKDIDGQIKMRYIQINDGNANENTISNLKSLIKQRQEVLNNNSDIISDINSLNNLEERNIREFNMLNNKLKKEFKDISLADVFNGKADLDYRPSSRVLNSLSSTFVNSLLGISELGLDILSSPLPSDKQEQLKPLKNTLTKMQQGLALEQADVPAAKTILDKTLDNSASIALSLFGGAAVGLKAATSATKIYDAAKLAENVTKGAFFITTAGNEYSQSRLAQENAPGIIYNLENKLAAGDLSNSEIEQTKKEIARQKEIQNNSALALGSVALTKGAAEVLFEGIQLKFLGKTVTKDLFDISLKNIAKDIPAYLKVGAKGIAVNNVQETFTQITNNSIDNLFETLNYTEANYKSLIDGIDKDFFAVNTITGGLTSTIASAPSVINKLSNVGKTSTDKRIFKELSLQYKELGDKLLSSDNLDVISDIKDQQLNIIKRAAVYNAELASKLEDLSVTQLDQLFDLYAEEQTLMNSAAKMASSDFKYAEADTKKEFERINKDLKRVNLAKDEIINQYTEDTRGAKPAEFSAKQIFLTSQTNLGRRIAEFKFGKENVLDLNFKNIKGIPTLEDYKNAIEAFDPTFKDDSILKSFADGSGNAAILPNGKVLINSFAIQAKINLTSPAYTSVDTAAASVAAFHEMLHAYSLSKFSDINTDKGKVALGKAIDEIKENLKRNLDSGSLSEENYNLVLNRIESNTRNLKNNPTLVYEETMNALEEMVRLGYIKRSNLQDNSFNIKNLIDMLRANAFGSLSGAASLDGSTANDIIYHLKSFEKFASNQKILSAPTNEETAEAMLSYGEPAYKKRIDELEEKLLSGQIDYDEYDAQMGIIDNEIAAAKVVDQKEPKLKTKGARITEDQQKLNDKVNALVGPKDADGNYTVTQDEWKKRGIEKAYNQIIQGTLIDPLITRGITGETVYGKPIDQFIEDVKMGLSDVLLRFNPEKNDSLIGFINSQLGFRKGDVLNKYKKEAGTESIDIEEGEVGALKELESQEDAEFEIFKQEQLAEEKEAKKRPNLFNTVKLEDDVKSAIDTTTVKAIAVNIKKFDQEISKNRTITPFVADLKKDLADSLEDKFVSYIRKYGLEDFLKDYREVFLLNMPTTFLSKHPVFRKGILKRVNGKWVEPTKVGKEKYDWVDAKGNKLKIDRDNALEGRGLTSGPEFIKRNPNITSVLSENEFVDYHFMDGANRRLAKRNPLSSLARQMASEISFELIQKDLREEGKLTEEIANRASIYGLIITENEIADIDKNLDRGLIKLSSGAELWPEKNKSTVLGAEYQNLEEFYLSVFTGDLAAKDAFDFYFSIPFANSTLSEAEKEKFRLNVTRYAKFTYKELFDKLKINEQIEYAVIRAINNTLKGSVKSNVFGARGLPPKLFSNIVKDNILITFDYYKNVKNLPLVESSEDALINTLTALYNGLTNLQSKAFNNNKELLKYLKNTLIPQINKKYPKDKLNSKLLSIDGNNVISYNKRKIDARRDNVRPYQKQEARGKIEEASNLLIGNKIDFNKFIETSGIIDRNAQSDFNRKTLKELLTYYKILYNNGDITPDQLYTFFGLVKNDLDGLLKGAYDVSYIAYLDGETLFEPVYEHNLPANELAIALVKPIVDKNISINEFQNLFDKKFENANVIIADKRINDLITKFGLAELMDIISGKRYLSDIIRKNIPNLRIIDIRTGEELSREAMSTMKLSQGESLDEISTSKYFNEMLERKKGVPANENISEVTARLEGRGKGTFQVFVPPSAEDFEGLLYFFMGEGRRGEDDRTFFQEKLLIPIAEGNYQLNYERQILKKKYAALIKANKGIVKRLREESNYKFYTIDSAVRVYIWDKLKYDIPGLYDKDIIELVKIVESDPVLKKFADQMSRFPRRGESWRKPEANWAAGSLEYDLQQTIDRVGRKRIFAKFIENKKLIFSEANLNKIEAAYGTNFRGALEDMLYRIEKGRAREAGSDRIINTYMNWVRGSVAVTMFLNTRSALLQQLSMVNFTNWEENNPFAQAKAFADTKQWAKDWAMLWNSDWMKERREGLKTDINESELVTALEANKNKPQALLHWLLTKGFSLTKYGDNFAIATGGSAYYRNRVNKYIAEGFEKAEAERKAFLDFQEIAERTQQSSRQDLLSNQQVSVAGRLFLAFQNTPMQMTRLTKKALLDLVNNRGSKRANISKILYYSTIQNMIFAFFQNALFAIAGLGDDEEDEKLIDSKTERAINNVLDSILRGSGITGGVISTIKNVIIQVKKQEDAGWKGDSAYVLLEAANVAPPVGIKARRFYGAYKNYKINKNIIDKVPYTNLNHPLYGITGSLTGAAFNVPLDRVISKANNLAEASNSENEAWQRIALFLGYNTWDLGIKDKEIERIRKITKELKKKPSGRTTGRGSSGRSTGR